MFEINNTTSTQYQSIVALVTGFNNGQIPMEVVASGQIYNSINNQTKEMVTNINFFETSTSIRIYFDYYYYNDSDHSVTFATGNKVLSDGSITVSDTITPFN